MAKVVIVEGEPAPAVLEPIEGELVAAEPVAAVEAIAEASVEIARIEGETAVELAKIDAEARVQSDEIFTEAMASITQRELDECRTDLANALERCIALETENTALRSSIPPPSSEPPQNLNVQVEGDAEVMQASLEAPEPEATPPEPPKRVPAHHWI